MSNAERDNHHNVPESVSGAHDSRDLKIKQLYISSEEGGQGMTGYAIAREVGLTPPMVYRILKRMGVEIRPVQKDPEGEARRLAGIQRVWQDPESRSQILAKIHTPENTEKRLQGIRNKYEIDQEYRYRATKTRMFKNGKNPT